MFAQLKRERYAPRLMSSTHLKLEKNAFARNCGCEFRCCSCVSTRVAICTSLVFPHRADPRECPANLPCNTDASALIDRNVPILGFYTMRHCLRCTLGAASLDVAWHNCIRHDRRPGSPSAASPSPPKQPAQRPLPSAGRCAFELAHKPVCNFRATLAQNRERIRSCSPISCWRHPLSW